jgi:hypothetical protein
LLDNDSDDDDAEHQKLTKLEQDLNEIKKRNEDLKQNMPTMSKRESKQYQKLIKEKDKLEREALVERMQMRDQEMLVVKPEAEEHTIDELREMVPELRLKSRQMYLKQREEQVMDLYKRNLDDEVRVFGSETLTPTEQRIF